LLAPEDLRAIGERVSGYPVPALSVYLNVNPASAENRRKAYVIRLKDALRENEVPGDLMERVLSYVESERPRMRTLVLFAAPEGRFETYWLQAELPEEVRWGEPYVAPLELALDEYEPTGIALFDAKRFRFFVTALGQVGEELKDANVFDTAGWREITISPSTARPRGGTARDLFEQRLEEWTRRFYREVAGELRQTVERFGIRRLILAGPEKRTAELRSVLPREIEALVAASAHLPADASEGEVLRRVSELQERLERRHERELLGRAAEEGIAGLDATLSALQEGRIYLLLAPWPLEGEAYWCDSCRLAFAGRPANGSCRYCGGPVRERPLADALLELAGARDARIEFMRAGNARTLREEFGGLAGLTRF
jgi:hypothetical protein